MAYKYRGDGTGETVQEKYERLYAEMNKTDAQKQAEVSAAKQRRQNRRDADAMRKARQAKERKLKKQGQQTRVYPGGSPLAPCGTHSAYKRHKRWGEEIDEACKKAYKERNREKYLANTNSKSRKVEAPCGTPAAYNRHQRRGEEIDEACREAHAEEMRRIRAKKKHDEERKKILGDEKRRVMDKIKAGTFG